MSPAREALWWHLLAQMQRAGHIDFDVLDRLELGVDPIVFDRDAEEAHRDQRDWWEDR